jgi:hypothetical protein
VTLLILSEAYKDINNSCTYSTHIFSTVYSSKRLLASWYQYLISSRFISFSKIPSVLQTTFRKMSLLSCMSLHLRIKITIQVNYVCLNTQSILHPNIFGKQFIKEISSKSTLLCGTSTTEQNKLQYVYLICAFSVQVKIS